MTYQKVKKELALELGIREDEVQPGWILDRMEDSEDYHDGHERGSCYLCKMD